MSEVQGKLEKNSYTTQAEVDADVEALGALWVYNGVAPALPRVTEISQYADAPGYMIDTAADMEYVAEDVYKRQGVSCLRGGSYAVIPDQIEAGTYMAAAARCV